MAFKNNTKKVFICLVGSNVVGAGSTLLNLYNNTLELHGKSYHYFARKLNGCNTLEYLSGGLIYKVVKYEYAK